MKDHIRDYATEAFRFYARWGTKESYIQYLLSDIQKQKSSGIGSPTEAALLYKEMIMRDYAAELLDLQAVENVLKICENEAEADVLDAIRIVYFMLPHKPLERGDIKMRILNAAKEMSTSESQVYRWLRRARKLFAEERELRVNKIFRKK